MFRRRRRGREPATEDGDRAAAPAGASDDGTAGPDGAEYTEPAAGPSEPPAPKADRPNGPFDAAEVDIEQIRRTHIDLGGLLVPRTVDVKLQMQVDERTGLASNAMLLVGDAAVQLIVVAAPRSTGLWPETAEQVIADATGKGGKAEQASGPFGPEVRVVLPVTTPEGKKAVQPSRITGIDGPRWMLRATFLGRATTDPAMFGRMVQLVRDTVIVRGQQPMVPGEVIALRSPQRSEPSAPTDRPEPGLA